MERGKNETQAAKQNHHELVPAKRPRFTDKPNVLNLVQSPTPPVFVYMLVHTSLNFLLFIIIIGIGPTFSKVAWPPNIGCIHWSSYSPFSNRICLEIGRTTSTAVFMQIAYIVLIWCLVSGIVALFPIFSKILVQGSSWRLEGKRQSSFR